MAEKLPSPGDVIAGRFHLEAEIGRGGMGVVMRARDPANAVVAVKVLLPETIGNPEAVPRFLNEARATRELTSEHAVRVFEIGTLDIGLPFMVMELLDGVDLGTMLEQRGPLPIAETCDAVIEACHALAEAHARGMVHRDLKPANLFAARQPDGSIRIKVLDFGLSKLAAQARHVALTSTGAFLGSPHYMAPEQLKSAKGVDARADIWSLGVVLYELLTSKMPFEGRTFGQLFMEIVSQEPPSASTHRADIPPGLVEIIERCMKKDREERYADLATLTAALARFASPKGAALSQRITGGARSPMSSLPEMPAAPVPGPEARPTPAPAPPEPRPTSKLGGTMIMANAPPIVMPSRVPPPHTSGPEFGPPGAVPNRPPTPIPMAPTTPSTMPRPMAPVPTTRGVPLPTVLAIVAGALIVGILGIVLGMTVFRR